MSMVMFATRCDHCRRRSPEYEAWPVCRACLAHTCPDCTVAGTEHEADLDKPATVRCVGCGGDDDALHVR